MMEYRKNMMKTSLAENLRALMVKKMFEKITIKNICDETGVIRATFYNYFEDKYDCLNWIVYTDLLGSRERIMRMSSDALVERALTNVLENLEFYHKGYLVTGQNSFEDMIRANLTEALLIYFDENRKTDYMPQYPNEVLAGYYAEGFAYIIRAYVHNPNRLSISETRKMTIELMNHSFQNFLEK